MSKFRERKVVLGYKILFRFDNNTKSEFYFNEYVECTDFVGEMISE